VILWIDDLGFATPHARDTSSSQQERASSADHVVTKSRVQALLLLYDRELHTLALWQRYCGLVGVSNDHNVVQSGRELVASAILHMHDIERTLMLLS